MVTENPDMPAGQSFGQSGVLYLLATAEDPLTVTEMHDLAPVESKGAIGNTVRQLYQKGLLARRERDIDRKHGKVPYEYAILKRESVEYINE